MVPFFLSLLRDAAAEWAGAQRRTLLYARLLPPDARGARPIGDAARYSFRRGAAGWWMPRALVDGTGRWLGGANSCRLRRRLGATAWASLRASRRVGV